MHRTRLARIAAAAVASALILVGVVAAPAQAVTNGVITGRVTAPLALGANAYVSAVRSDGVVAASSVFSSNGTYRMSVRAGSYHLEFIPDRPELVRLYYPGGATTVMSSPTYKVVAAKTVAVNATVPRGASIQGSVGWGATPPYTGSPDIRVYDAAGVVVDRSVGSLSGSGSFAFSGLAPGTYRIGATRPQNVPEFWGGPTLDTATSFTVAAGETQTGVEFSLPALPSVTGTADYLRGDGVPESLYANIKVWDVDAAKFVATLGTTSLAPHLEGWRAYLPAGRYQFLVPGYDPNYLNLADTWAGSVATQADSPIYTIGMGDAVTGVDITRISGGRANVSTTGMHYTLPIDMQLLLKASDGSWNPVVDVSDSDGSESFSMLAPGVYTIKYSAHDPDPRFEPGYLGGPDLEHASTFTVTKGQTALVQIQLHRIAFDPFARDIDGDGNADLLVRNTAGQLIVGYGDGVGGIRGTEKLTPIYPKTWRLFWGGDFTGGGNADIMGIAPDGYFYALGDLKRLSQKVRVAGPLDWRRLSPAFGTGDFTGDGTGDLIGRDASGKLQVCNGDGFIWCAATSTVGGTLAPSWKSMTSIFSPGDFDGDTHPDLIARDAAGTLWMYPGDGAGGILPRTKVAAGFSAIALISVGDFDGDGNSDLVGRDQAGTMWLYPGDGHGALLPRSKIVSGWGSLQLIP